MTREGLRQGFAGEGAAEAEASEPVAEEAAVLGSVIRVPDTGDSEFNRAYAARVLSRITQHYTFSADQVASMAKWLMASLLAINGAGAIAAINGTAQNELYWLAGLFFVIGVGFALISGVAMQEVYNRTLGPLRNSDRYWTCVSISGLRDEPCETRLEIHLKHTDRFAFVPPLLGWVSGMFFVAGALTMAFS